MLRNDIEKKFNKGSKTKYIAIKKLRSKYNQ